MNNKQQTHTCVFEKSKTSNSTEAKCKYCNIVRYTIDVKLDNAQTYEEEKMENETQKIDGYWVIGTNKWNADIFTKEEAENEEKTLINCSNCIDCISCSNCNDCSFCIGCNNCVKCHFCRACDDCIFCHSCSGCKDCQNCINCSNCIGCIGCSACDDCSFCRDCRGCRDCNDCHNCNHCIDCSSCFRCFDCTDCRYCFDCRGFKRNPQRITSPILGSGNSQTTYYWNEDHEQIVWGSFKGTLQDFEEKVKERHGDTEIAKGYLDWIESVKNYKLTRGGNK